MRVLHERPVIDPSTGSAIGRPTLRTLRGEADEMAALQRVLEQAPAYAERITGAPPGPADAQSLYSALPPGKVYDDKFVFGVYLGDAMIGCVDLIRGWPDPATAHVGLLVLAESHHGRGFGRQVVALLEAWVARWATCDRLRIGVVRVNAAVAGFWRKQGFEPTGEVKPYAYGSVRSETVVMSKPLGRAPSTPS